MVASGGNGAPDRAEEILAEWRRRAGSTFLIVVAVGYLPAIALLAGRHDLAFTPLSRTIFTLGYIGIVIAALAPRANHAARMWVCLGTAYAAVAVLLFSQDHFASAAPPMLPALALVLIGVRAGRIAAFLSALLLLAPLLRLPPSLAADFVSAPRSLHPLPDLMAKLQVLGIAALLPALMIPLERFHAFVLKALAGERAAVAELRVEAAQRAGALRELEHEMEERRRLEREVARVGDEERQRLGQEVHDGVCQELAGALLRCQAMALRLEGGNAVGPQDLLALRALLQHAIDDAQAVARGLWPLESDPEALSRALRALARRAHAAGSRCEFRTAGETEAPDPEVARHLYRIAQEAVSNATRHARAGLIAMELRGEGEALLLSVTDDGVGLPDLPATGLGLRTMAYRAQLVEGKLNVARLPEGGTQVLCQVPRVLTPRPSLRPRPSEEEQAHGA